MFSFGSIELKKPSSPEKQNCKACAILHYSSLHFHLPPLSAFGYLPNKHWNICETWGVSIPQSVGLLLFRAWSLTLWASWIRFASWVAFAYRKHFDALQTWKKKVCLLSWRRILFSLKGVCCHSASIQHCLRRSPLD